MRPVPLSLLAVLMLMLVACGTTTVDTTGALPPATSATVPASDPTFPKPSTTTAPVAPATTTTTAQFETTTTVPAVSAAGCITTPGALQDLLDATPDGRDVSDMKGKLVNAEALGFSVLDLSRTCYENQGTIVLDGRYGLWLIRPTTIGTDWVLSDTADTVLSGIDLGGGSLTIVGGNQRIEAGEVGDLSVSGSTDFMMGKMTVTGHAHFDSMKRKDSDKSFVRNTTFETVEITGDIQGFKIEGSSAESVTDDTTNSSGLNLDVAVR